MNRLILILISLISILNFTSCEKDRTDEHTTEPPDPPQVTTVFQVNNRQVLLNGNPVFLKGMSYHPVPPGQSPGEPPNGDYFTDNYSSLFKPDIDKMRAMGINAIKIYSWYPEQQHKVFLDYCFNSEKPIYVGIGYFMPEGTVISQFNEKLNAFISIADKTKNHPAVFGYMLGNENVGNDINNPEFWQKLNQISDTLRKIAPDKITFTGLVDDNMNSVSAGNIYMTSLSVWGINVFRGRTLGNFYSTYAAVSGKPVFITELGFPSSIRVNGIPQPMPDNSNEAAVYSGSVIREIDSHRSDKYPDEAVAGVFWFEFTDEWWKQECPECWSPQGQPCACTKSTHDYTKNGAYSPFPGGWWDEEWFGVYTADRLPRAVVDTIKIIWSN